LGAYGTKKENNWVPTAQTFMGYDLSSVGLLLDAYGTNKERALCAY